MNYSRVVNAEKIAYYRDKISAMPDDLADPFDYLNPGILKAYDTYEGKFFLPEPTSEFAVFRDLLWCGLHESAVDVIAGKCKKIKFLNDIVNVKQRFLEALRFIEANGDRNIYWSRGDNPEQTWTVDSERLFNQKV